MSGKFLDILCLFALQKTARYQVKSSQNIFIKEIHIHIKYIGKTEAQQGVLVPSVSEFNKIYIYNNLFVDQQTQQSNRGVSIGVHFNKKCLLWVH